MPTLHVLTNKYHLDPGKLPGTVVVVLDVAFATTGIAIALEQGATAIVPTLDPNAARRCAQGLPPGTFLLAGEVDTQPIPGFLDPWPHVLMAQDMHDKTLIYSTTNGTVALQMASGAGHVYAAALVNGEAVADHVVRHHAGATILLLCAGSGVHFNLEDFYGAGYLVSLLTRRAPELRCTDAAVAARLLHERSSTIECLHEAWVGRMMKARGMEGDVIFTAQKSIFPAVPRFRDGEVRRA